MPQVMRFLAGFLAAGSLAILATAPALAQSPAPLSENERVLLAETFRLGTQLQDSVWSGWSEAPFALLLVKPEREVLLRHPRPSSDFTAAAYDQHLGDTLYTRPRQFPPNLRATFPAVGGVPTIVTGLPDSTDTPTGWVLTALHEHFHQLQMSRPGYYAAVDSLGLSGGDDSGQWMLNYPFPYDSAEVQERFGTLTHRLGAALQSANQPSFQEKVAAYLCARRRFRQTLPADDYRYFSFQLWQEGVARYTEYKIAQRAARQYTPSDTFAALDGYLTFPQAATDLRNRILHQLSKASLSEEQRIAFYPLGAAEALLLDHVNPDWHERYWTHRFCLECHFGVKSGGLERSQSPCG